MPDRKIHLNSPAQTWEDGLPIGTGRISAMVTGDDFCDILTLNHERLWSNQYPDRKNENRFTELAEIRRHLSHKQWPEAAELMNRTMAPRGGISGIPVQIGSFLPAGELTLRFRNVSTGKYCRILDMEQGSVIINSCKIRREYLADYNSDIIAGKISSENPFYAEIELSRNCEIQNCPELKIAGTEISICGKIKGEVYYHISLHLASRTEKMKLTQNTAIFPAIREFSFQLNIGVGTDSASAKKEAEFTAMETFTGVSESHLGKYRELFSGFSLNLSSTQGNDKNIHPSEELCFFNYARYLMAATCFKATLPPNLQGKWNADPQPPWRSDYHLDINLQMNFWMVNPLRCDSWNQLLFDLILNAAPNGREAAKALWGCRGIWFPWALDNSGATTPEGHGWGLCVTTAAWMAQHFYTHYEYTLDHKFLEEKCYPFMKECSLFFEDFLTEDENKILHISPSMSPENAFEEGGPMPVSIAVDSACEIEIVAELLGNSARAAEILGKDPDKQILWRSMKERLPRIRTGKDGKILEWGFDVTEKEPGHRHLSQLYALYPGNGIDRIRTPELYEAARRSLAYRIAHTKTPVGWSRAWSACLYASLRDGNAAYEILSGLIHDQTSMSLLALHPPRIFQIDGNLGGAAAVLAMLLRSEYGEIEPLPALPDAWPSGNIMGIGAKGGFILDFAWADKKLHALRLKSKTDTVCRLRVNVKTDRILDEKNRSIPFNIEEELVCFTTKAGIYYLLNFTQ